MFRFLLLFLLLAPPALAADMPVKAQVPFVLGYSGSGWYKFIGTFAEINDSTTSIGNVTTAGGALNAGVGYQWANSGGGTFGALQGSCAYHNVGGSNIVGSITSRWSCDAMVKFGGPITNVLQWLPSNVSMPALPAVGSAVGSAHPYVGGGARIQDAHADLIGASHHNVDVKGFLAAGILQQYCTAPTSCITMDTFFTFAPKQGDGFNVVGVNQNLGKQYRAGVNFAF